MELKDIIALPWAIQLALGSGYAAYVTAYTGIRDHHKTIEIVFATLVFSLVTTAAFFLFGLWFVPWAAGVSAFTTTVLSGAGWRKWGRSLLRKLQRGADLSWSDDSPTAWATILENSKHPISQIAVQLNDGTWLRCDDAAQFTDAPFGCCVLGLNGDVAFYLTHEELPDEPAKKLQTVRDDFYGDRITYVPAAQVKTVTIRHKRV